MLVTVTREDHETRSVNRGRQVEVGGGIKKSRTTKQGINFTSVVIDVFLLTADGRIYRRCAGV